MLPPKLRSSIGWIANQKVDLGWAEIARIDLDQDATRFRVNALFVNSCALPNNLYLDLAKRFLDEFTHRMSFACRKHVIVGLRTLQNSPHTFNIIFRMTPIALGVQITKKQSVL